MQFKTIAHLSHNNTSSIWVLLLALLQLFAPLLHAHSGNSVARGLHLHEFEAARFFTAKETAFSAPVTNEGDSAIISVGCAMSQSQSLPRSLCKNQRLADYEPSAAVLNTDFSQVLPRDCCGLQLFSRFQTPFLKYLVYAHLSRAPPQ